MAWDLMDEDCSDISDWTDADGGTGVSEVDPAGQFRFDTNLGAAGNAMCRRYRTIASPPNKFILEIKTYFDSLGTIANLDFARLVYQTATWVFVADFASDGLFIFKAGGVRGEVGTDIVKHDGTAAWQVWRFEVDKSGGEDAATVEVFLDDVSQGTFDCDYEVAATDGRIDFQQYGYETDNMVWHIDYVRALTGFFVSRERNILYDSVLELSKTRDIVYDSILELSKTRDIVYDSVLELSKTRDILYDSVLELSRERNIVYDSILEVSKTRDILYDLILFVSKERDIVYDLVLELSKERNIHYDSVLEVSKERNILYDLFELIQRLEAPVGVWEKQTAPTNGAVKQEKPTGVWEKLDRPSDGAVKLDRPTGNWVKQNKPS